MLRLISRRVQCCAAQQLHLCSLATTARRWSADCSSGNSTPASPSSKRRRTTPSRRGRRATAVSPVQNEAVDAAVEAAVSAMAKEVLKGENAKWTEAVMPIDAAPLSLVEPPIQSTTKEAAALAEKTTEATAVVAEAASTEAAALGDNMDQESFFASLVGYPGDGERQHGSGAASSSSAAFPDVRESMLVYNALTGRMTSELSTTMQHLQKIGCGVNSQRHVFVERPEVLNAFAARIRAGTAALPPKWPASLSRTIGGVISNKSITDPAAAVQHMIQVKTNSVLRSHYASVVNSSTDDTADAEAAQRDGVAGNPDESIELNAEQQHVIEVALKGHHLYIGGSAGTGKTVLLRALSRRLQAHRLRVAMTATTGVAGCHIGGSTFHHALGVSSRGDFVRRGSMLDYDVIIIDEVSMLSLTLFEEFDRVLREEAGTPDLPFGGVQIILCGDFLQLGCINEVSLIASKLFEHNFVKLRLETQVRQTANSKFAQDLQLMRLGIVPNDLHRTVQELPPGTMVESAVNLLPTNKEVHAANERELARLPGEALTLSPETGITSLQCETTATLLLRTTSTFHEAEFARHVRSLLQATLDLPRASLLTLYRIYEDGHAIRVMLPPGESVAWRDAMKERFLEVAGLLNDLELGATVTEILPKGDGLHTPETEEYLHKVMSKHPIAQPLTLKKGCRVLLRANLSSSLVNGSIGKVVDFVECKAEAFPEYIKNESVERCIDRYRLFCYTECGMPIPMVPVVQFYNGETVAIPPWEFTVGGGPNTHYYSLSSVALPLSLAYAFTVHKVQGLTLVGRVHLELSRMWPCEHLLYVAMSRVRNPEQLSVSSFSPKMVVANDECVQFDRSLRGVKQLVGATFAKFPIASWKRCNDMVYHLRRRGSSLRRLLEDVTTSSASNHHHSGAGRGRRPTTAVGEEQVTNSATADSSGFGGGAARSSGLGLTTAGDNDGINLEHLEGIHNSLLVARRMRKLIKHVERVAKITEAQRKAKVVKKATAGSHSTVIETAQTGESTAATFSSAVASLQSSTGGSAVTGGRHSDEEHSF